MRQGTILSPRCGGDSSGGLPRLITSISGHGKTFIALIILAGPGPGPHRTKHRHTDGVVRGEDRDHGPEDETEPTLRDINHFIVELAGGASCQAAPL